MDGDGAVVEDEVEEDHVDDCCEDYDSQLPSLYSLEKESSETAWASVRSCLLNVAIESNSLPRHLCMHCSENYVEYRCLQCEPPARFYCHTCLHKHILSSLTGHLEGKYMYI